MNAIHKDVRVVLINRTGQYASFDNGWSACRRSGEVSLVMMSSCAHRAVTGIGVVDKR